MRQVKFVGFKFGDKVYVKIQAPTLFVVYLISTRPNFVNKVFDNDIDDQLTTFELKLSYDNYLHELEVVKDLFIRWLGIKPNVIGIDIHINTNDPKHLLVYVGSNYIQYFRTLKTYNNYIIIDLDDNYLLLLEKIKSIENKLKKLDTIKRTIAQAIESFNNHITEPLNNDDDYECFWGENHDTL